MKLRIWNIQQKNVYIVYYCQGPGIKQLLDEYEFYNTSQVAVFTEAYIDIRRT